MERPTTSDIMAKRDHERDLELDKRIQALRRKNEALMKRYQEVEEDRKRAEEEGMALQSRKAKADDLTITISKSTSDTRVVVTKPCASGSPPAKAPQEAGSGKAGEGSQLGAGRARKKQLTVTMAGKKGKRVVSETAEWSPGPGSLQSPAEDGAEPGADQTTHTAKKDRAVQESESQLAATDLTIPTSKEEQEEYLCWKKERERIDRERVARHKNAKGQWRRAWDLDKTENMFSGQSLPEKERGPPSRGGRSARRAHPRANPDAKGHETRSKDKGNKNVPVVSSKAKGKDRLTGRARRWDANEEGEPSQAPEATLEFLEELDALTDPEAGEDGDSDAKRKSPSPEAKKEPEELEVLGERGGPGGNDTSARGAAEASPPPPRGAEKKVRFSEELIQRAPVAQVQGSSPRKTQREPRGTKVQLQSAQKDPSTDQRDQSAASGAPVPPAEGDRRDAVLPAATRSPPAEKSCASPQESTLQPKCSLSSRNTEDLIDSSLSVLSLESGEAHPTHTTSTDKARENGKIV